MSREAIRETAHKIVRSIYLRIASHYEGKTPERMQPAEQELTLEQWKRAIAHDGRLMDELVEHARAAGVEVFRNAMHGAEKVDHEMVDQAAEYALANEEKLEAPDGQ